MKRTGRTSDRFNIRDRHRSRNVGQKTSPLIREPPSPSCTEESIRTRTHALHRIALSFSWIFLANITCNQIFPKSDTLEFNKPRAEAQNIGNETVLRNSRDRKWTENSGEGTRNLTRTSFRLLAKKVVAEQRETKTVWRDFEKPVGTKTGRKNVALRKTDRAEREMTRHILHESQSIKIGDFEKVAHD